MSRRPPALAALGVALAFVSPAAAGDVRVDSRTVIFEAFAGEANVVTVTNSGAVVAVSDQGAPLVAGAGCRQTGATAAVCTGPEDPNIPRDVHLDVRLGDRADSAFLSAGWSRSGRDLVGVLSIRALGGPGGDALSLEGTNASTVVLAGVGDDTVIGGRWSDEVRLGPGNDRVEARGANDYVFEGPGDDRIDGGTGRDWVFFDGSRPIVGNLTTGRVSGSGRDRLLAVDNLGGTRFADTLIGDGVRNHLVGGPGDDLLAGRGGRDVLGVHEGEKGDDRLLGGAGDDALYAASGADVLVGGPGSDVFRAGAGSDTLVARDGERDSGNAGHGFDRARLDSALDRLDRLEATF